MKLFQCQACDQPLTFEATVCESCERRLGYVCHEHEVSALEPVAVSEQPGFAGTPVFHAYAQSGERYRFCANAAHGACNWLVPDTSPDVFCTCCRHNQIVPDLTIPWNLVRWRQIEAGKHRLFYSLLRLDLPLVTRAQYVDGLAFDFLVDPSETPFGGPSVMTGHLDGLITLNIAEADDVERERRRAMLGEHYRTLLGHFRHEIGHYFWYVLVMNSANLERFRALFGDERASYANALRNHYVGPAPRDWEQSFVSSYATSHPWEDFAETFAHYLHIVDTVETASTFELHVRPRLRRGATDPVVIDFDPYRTPDLDRLIAAWLPLTYAINSLSRSMGQGSLYPFTLAPAVIEKLAFVHDLVYAARGLAPAAVAEEAVEADVLKAVIAGLRQKVPAPTL